MKSVNANVGLYAKTTDKIVRTAGVTGQQRMLNPPRHLILPHDGCDLSAEDAYSYICICRGSVLQFYISLLD
jgi:hypothetical protein